MKALAKYGVVLTLALYAACSPAYNVAARATHAKRTCAPTMLENLDFASVAALLAVSALAFKADRPVRGGVEVGAAVGIAIGSTAAGSTCVK